MDRVRAPRALAFVLALTAALFGCPASPALDAGGDDDPDAGNASDDAGAPVSDVDAGGDASLSLRDPGDHAETLINIDEPGTYAVALLDADGGCPDVDLALTVWDFDTTYLYLYSAPGSCTTTVVNLPATAARFDVELLGFGPANVSVFLAPVAVEPFGDFSPRSVTVEPGRAVALELDVEAPAALDVGLDWGAVCGGPDPHPTLLFREEEEIWVRLHDYTEPGVCGASPFLVSPGPHALLVVSLPHQEAITLDIQTDFTPPTPLAIGDTLIGDDANLDLYSFSLDDVRWISVRSLIDSGDCPLVEIFESSPQSWPVSRAVGGGPAATVGCEPMSALLDRGDYFVVLHRSSAAPAPYGLKLDERTPIDLDEQVLHDGTIEGSGDIPVYVIHPEAAGVLRARLEQALGLCDGSSDAYLSLGIMREANGAGSLYWIASEWTNDGPCFELEVSVEPDPYYLIVSGDPAAFRVAAAITTPAAAGEACDRRELEHDCTDGTLCLMTDNDGAGVCGAYGPDETLPEAEPNNTTEEARGSAFVPPARFAASVTAEGDGDPFDLFVVDLSEAAFLQVATHGPDEACDDVDTVIYRIDPMAFDDGTAEIVFGTEGVFAANDQQPLSNCARLTEALPAGRHYFFVSSFAQAFAFDYEVSFTLPALVAPGGRCDPDDVQTVCSSLMRCLDLDGDGDGVCSP